MRNFSKKKKFKVKFLKKVTECRNGKFGTLLIKSRAGRKRGIILKKFEVHDSAAFQK